MAQTKAAKEEKIKINPSARIWMACSYPASLWDQGSSFCQLCQAQDKTHSALAAQSFKIIK